MYYIFYKYYNILYKYYHYYLDNNYLEVYQAVAQEMGQSSHLLEHIARRVGNRLLSQFPGIKSIGVKLYKLNPPLGGQMQSVSVELTLTR